MIEKSVIIKLIRKHQEFHASIALNRGSLEELALHLDRLHIKEKIIYQNFKHDIRKTSYLLGRLVAKQAIIKLRGVTRASTIWIDSGVFQFPVVKCLEIHNTQVSISHGDNIGSAAAFPEAHPMGIDVEKVIEDKKDAILSQLTEAEKSLLETISMDNIVGYTMIWSMKESLSKVIRTGLMLDFKFLEVNKINVEKGVFESTFSQFGQYKAYAYAKGDYVLAITLPEQTKVDLDQVWGMFDSLF